MVTVESCNGFPPPLFCILSFFVCLSTRRKGFVRVKGENKNTYKSVSV